jgi:hypothetical protein
MLRELVADRRIPDLFETDPSRFRGRLDKFLNKEPRYLSLVLWIWQASEVLEATARHAIYGVQWRRLDRKWLGLLKDRS